METKTSKGKEIKIPGPDHLITITPAEDKVRVTMGAGGGHFSIGDNTPIWDLGLDRTKEGAAPRAVGMLSCGPYNRPHVQ